MTAESEVVRDLLSSITGVPFRIDEPKENRLLLRKRAVWFVWATSITHSRLIGPLKAAWKDADGSIWLETSKIADMVELVERRYGQASLVRMPDGTPGVAPSGMLPDEVANFPQVVKLLKECERIVAEISEKTGMQVKVLYDGGEGVTTFRIGARIDTPGSDEEALRQRVVATAKLLKEAYVDVRELMTR